MLTLTADHIRAKLRPDQAQLAMSIPGYQYDARTDEWLWPACRANAITCARVFGYQSCEAGLISLASFSDMTIVDGPKSKTRSWQHQSVAYIHAGGLRNLNQPAALFAMGMGTGKSKVAVDLLNFVGARLVLIVCPKSAVESVWPAQFERHSIKQWNVVPLAFGDTKKSLEKAKASLAQTPAALVCNYDMVWRKPFSDWLRKQKIDVVIYDECCASGTLISTPHGEIPIERIRDGDVVFGVDELGSIVETEVKHTFVRDYDGPLYECDGLLVTGNHPIWTDEFGYRAAEDLDSMCFTVLKYTQGGACYAHASLRMVREDVHSGKGNQSREAKAVLRNFVLCEVEDEPARDKGESPRSHRPGEGEEVDERSEGETGCAGEVTCPSSRGIQPVSLGGDSQEGSTCLGREGMGEPERRERQAASGSATGAPSAPRERVGSGVCSVTATEEHGISELLQTGHRGSSFESRCRDRRTQPQGCVGEDVGREEEGVPVVYRVDDPEILERRGGGGPRICSKASYRRMHVYNLETGTGNYFASGILVHNCHRLKDPGGRASSFASLLVKSIPYRIGLTGTPMPHSPLDVYGYFRALDPRIFGTSHSNFMSRYAKVVQRETRSGQRYPEVVDIINREELNERFYSIAYRVETDDLPELNLPEFQDIHLYCELPKKARTIYEEMKQEFIAWLESGEVVTAANAAVKVLKLQQIASGVLKTSEDTWESIHDAKIDLLRDLVEDCDEPAVISCHYRADLDRVAHEIRKMGKSVSMLDGRHNQLCSWQAGETQFLVLQEQSGSEAIDCTRARYMWIYSNTFKNGTYQQLRRRIHRPGQSRAVRYYHLLARNTVDEKILEALKRKEDLVRSILDGHVSV